MVDVLFVDPDTGVPYTELPVKVLPQFFSQSGALFVEGIRDDIALTFSRDRGQSAITNALINEGSVNGTATHDAAAGQVVVAVPATAGSTAYFRSLDDVEYRPGHMIRGGLTVEISALPSTGRIEWGFGEDNGSGGVLNAVLWGLDSAGLYAARIRAGVYVAKTYRAAFNRDKLDGSVGSRFTLAGAPVALNVLANNIYELAFDWYGAAPPTYLVTTPSGEPIPAHIEQTTGVIAGTTIPEPLLPMFVRVTNGSTAQALSVRSGSWRGGVFTNEISLASQRPDGGWVTGRASGVARDIGGLIVQSNTPLAAGGVFTSGWVATDGWSGIELDVTTNVVSATNGVVLEYTDDVFAPVPVVRSTRARTFGAADVGAGFSTARAPVRLGGVRARYTNGGTAQASFFLSLELRTLAVELPQGSLTSAIDPTSTAITSRNSVFAQNLAGQFADIGRSLLGGLDVALVEHEVETPIKALQAWFTNQANVSSGVAVQLVGSPLAGRKTVLVKNRSDSTKVIYIGTSASVTISSGYELAAGEGVEIDLDPSITGIWAIAESGTQRACWLEVGSI